jgi:hypothetical protein
MFNETGKRGGKGEVSGVGGGAKKAGKEKGKGKRMGR